MANLVLCEFHSDRRKTMREILREEKELMKVEKIKAKRPIYWNRINNATDFLEDFYNKLGDILFSKV